MEIKMHVKERRAACGLSRARLAAKAEVDPSTIYKVEKGVNQPTMKLLRKLGEVFRAEGNPFPIEIEEAIGLTATIQPK